MKRGEEGIKSKTSWREKRKRESCGGNCRFNFFESSFVL
jgi:hypothetical protein